MDIINFCDAPAETSCRRLAELPGRVVAGDPQHDTQLLFTSPDGGLMAGVWTSTPGRWHTFRDRDEYCHIISGRCALISKTGQRWEFEPGSSFMIPDGFVGFWEVMETTTKHFVIRSNENQSPVLSSVATAE